MQFKLLQRLQKWTKLFKKRFAITAIENWQYKSASWALKSSEKCDNRLLCQVERIVLLATFQAREMHLKVIESLAKCVQWFA